MPRLLKNIYYTTIIYFINQAFTDESFTLKNPGSANVPIWIESTSREGDR